MSHRQEQKISVSPDTLPNLIAGIERGDYRIPQFQREFVWKKPKIIALLDSIYREYPIGSFFLWKVGREHNRLFRQTVDLDIAPVEEHDSISFILDGQQRSTALYITLKGMVVNGVDYGRISFDLKDEKFTDRRSDGKRYVAVSEIWGPGNMMLVRQLDEEYADSFTRCCWTLQTYPVSLVEVRDKDLAAARTIFRRVNQEGQRLSRFDLIAATTFSPDFNLRERFTADVVAPLKKNRFGGVAPAVATQLMALFKRGQCTERHEFSLTTECIQKLWKLAVSAVLLAADTLRKNMGVADYGYLPYDAQLTLLAYYFMKSGKRSLSAEHMAWLSRWFWRSAFGQRYGAGGPTRMGQDRELLDQLIAGSTPEFDIPVHASVDGLVKVRMTQTRSAVRNAFLCLLAFSEPRHLRNNGKLNLAAGSISGFTDSEKHHIFPKAFLQCRGPAGAEIHSLPNFCFLPSELNKEILDGEPASYFAKLQQENPEFDKAAQSSLLPNGPGSGVPENDYLRFLNARGMMLVEAIRRLCGEITTPQQDERQAAIERIECRVRDLIDRALSERVGAGYWKTDVPPDVRDNADRRISEAMARYPDLKEDEFILARRRLDYCNLMDYLTIIENKANWPVFEGVFRKKRELQQYLSGFNEYRNVVMHSREMSELVEANGRAALIWLANVLADDDEQEEEDIQNA